MCGERLELNLLAQTLLELAGPGQDKEWDKSNGLGEESLPIIHVFICSIWKSAIDT